MPDTTSRLTLKQWFSNGCRPNEYHFAALIDSLYHRDDPLPISSIEGLDNLAINLIDQAIGSVSDFTEAFAESMETSASPQT